MPPLWKNGHHSEFLGRTLIIMVSGFHTGRWETGIPPQEFENINITYREINSEAKSQKIRGEECPQSRTLLMYKEFPPPKLKILYETLSMIIQSRYCINISKVRT